MKRTLLRPATMLSLRRALGAGNLTLWDEERGKLVRFRDVDALER